MKENKFGINLSQLGGVLDKLKEMKNVKLIGIHSHIGSQITDMSSFRNLVIRFNEIQEELEAHGVTVENLNFGGGLVSITITGGKNPFIDPAPITISQPFINCFKYVRVNRYILSRDVRSSLNAEH